MEICCICLEPTQHKLECRRFNCIDCLKRLIKKSYLCPICRREFNIHPYKYNPPKHTPNLKINKTTIKFLNKFLNCRYLLKNGKHQKYYANLQSAYHSFIYVDGKYINPQIISTLNKFECLELYIFFGNKNCMFHPQIRQQFRYAIQEYLCMDYFIL